MTNPRFNLPSDEDEARYSIPAGRVSLLSRFAVFVFIFAVLGEAQRHSWNHRNVLLAQGQRMTGEVEAKQPGGGHRPAQVTVTNPASPLGRTAIIVNTKAFSALNVGDRVVFLSGKDVAEPVLENDFGWSESQRRSYPVLFGLAIATALAGLIVAALPVRNAQGPD